MGVLGLWGLLESVGHPINVQGLEGKVLGVDANIWLYKFIRGFREKDNASYNIESHKLGLFNRICKLLFYRIKPVFVFDGPAPVLKRRTLERRQDFRNKHLSKFQDAAMKAMAAQLKAQYPDKNIDDLKIHLPQLKSNNLVAAEKFTEEDEDLFYIPPHIRNEELKDPDGSNSSRLASSSDDSDIEEIYEPDPQFGTGKVDINSEDFQQLPPELRYEILHGIKESKSRIRNAEALPEDPNCFSSLQLQRLNARRKIQEKIEKCEKDICANFTGELSDGRSVQAFRVHSDARSTLLYRSSNDTYISNSQRSAGPFSSQTTPIKDVKNEQNAEEESPSKCYRPSLKLLFAENEASYIRLPGTKKSTPKIEHVSQEGPSLSPAHSSDNPPDSHEKFDGSTKSPSNASTIIDETDVALESKISPRKIDSDDESTRSEVETIQTQNITTIIESSETPAKSDIMIDLVTPNHTNKTKSKDDSVVDLTESINESEAEKVGESHIVRIKKADITIDISDDDEVEDSEINVSGKKRFKEIEEKEKEETTTEATMSQTKNKDEPGIESTTKNISSSSQPNPSEAGEESRTQETQKAPATVPTPSMTTSSSQPTTSSSTTAATITMAVKDAMRDANPQRANKVTGKIVDDAKELLRLFGIPFVDAAGEAEAQCAKLEELNLTAGTITDDSDIWLFGAQNVYRYFFNDDKYVMQYKMKDIAFQLGMTREYLVCFAMLVGSDYTDGIMNVGPVNAMEILSEFEGENIEPLVKFSDWHQQAKQEKKPIPVKVRRKLLKFNLPEEFPSRAVFEGYLKPAADASTEQFSWGNPDLDDLRDYAMRNFGWDQKKADEKLVPLMKRLNEKKIQPTIDTFFFKTEANRNPELFRSKRVNHALNKIAKRTARDVKVAAPADPPEEVNLSEDED